MRCPDHLTVYPPATGCPWCRLEAEATDQSAGAARVRAAMRVPPAPPPVPTLDEIEDQLNTPTLPFDQVEP